MFSALYFPHTQLSPSEVGGERILKRALLMWDHLEFIVPDPNFPLNYDDPVVARAIELIGKKHVPGNDEKTEAHRRIEELVTRPDLPDIFQYSGSDPYEIYPQKFLPDTWKILADAKMVGDLSSNEDYPLSHQAGFAVMSILADCCAGETRSRVTDRAQAYASLTGLLTDKPDESSLRDRALDATLRAAEREESLISLRLSLPDVDSVGLDQLIEFREREAIEGSHNLEGLRHKYVERIETHVKEITTNPKLTKSDIEERERVFFQESLNDLASLNEELRRERRDAILSRDVLVAFVSVASTFATLAFPEAHVLQGVVTLAGAPVTVGGAISARNKFVKARGDLLRKHPLALIHELMTSA
jgi:hypothetical protein